jgi:hypothetical protein
MVQYRAINSTSRHDSGRIGDMDALEMMSEGGSSSHHPYAPTPPPKDDPYSYPPAALHPGGGYPGGNAAGALARNTHIESFAWNDLRIAVLDRKTRKSKVLLTDVSGIVHAGELQKLNLYIGRHMPPAVRRVLAWFTDALMSSQAR